MKKTGYYEAGPHGITFHPYEKKKNMQPLPDPFKKIREWKREYYEETCNPDVTEQYNGFTVEVRFSCQCHEVDDPVCGNKFFVLTPEGKIYTDGYIYYGGNDKALNAAYEAIDNGKIPEDA